MIAIIGGGASGTLTAIHLLRAAAARQYPLRIALIDRLGRTGWARPTRPPTRRIS